MMSVLFVFIIEKLPFTDTRSGSGRGEEMRHTEKSRAWQRRPAVGKQHSRTTDLLFV
jgi:hypothetical protein